MILSYIFRDKITKMDISPDLIRFGSYRVAVRSIASVSAPRDLRIWKALDANAVPINVIAFIAITAIGVYARKSYGSIQPALAAFGLALISYIAIICFAYWLFRMRARRNLVILTNGGNVTVFTNIRRRFALECVRVLQDVMMGRETRRIHVDYRRRYIAFLEAAEPTMPAPNTAPADAGGIGMP